MVLRILTKNGPRKKIYSLSAFSGCKSWTKDGHRHVRVLPVAQAMLKEKFVAQSKVFRSRRVIIEFKIILATTIISNNSVCRLQLTAIVWWTGLCIADLLVTLAACVSHQPIALLPCNVIISHPLVSGL
ncbi:hypothetical protein PoB_004215000 [Plakobranchus ocellatus]|uniref:Uncharacterized protein n=1 Tax=Plakobranchus ocellatus TaxID=259542 RepID=A0AAV4B967_9GAST|nr:hypothetical protein PoB_004215000 [Plakobranchus ocellatus]